jgi:hypothetical protein
LNGPDWYKGRNYDLARCYAALLLGTTGDSRALEPLIAAMNTIDDTLDGREHISTFAVTGLGFLGDTNAVEPLIDALKSERAHITGESALALVRIGDLRAVGPMVEMLEEKQRRWREDRERLGNLLDVPEENRTTKMIQEADKAERRGKMSILEHDKLLTRLTKVEFNTELKRAQNPKMEVLAELSRQDANTLPELWSQWWCGGPQFTRGRFDAKRNEWKAMKKETQLEKSNANSKLSEMTDLGIPAIPFMVEKVGQGETDFIPLISKLTDKELAEDASIAECLDWWKSHKQQWLILFPEPGGLPADPNG